MKVIVHPLLPTGNFLNCRIGVEMDYPDDFSLEQAINIEWDKLLAIHMKRYPHLYNEKGEPLYEKAPMDDECRGVKVRDISPEESRLSATQSIINDINTCKEVKVLESYRLIAKSNPEIQTAYDNKLKLLNNGL